MTTPTTNLTMTAIQTEFGGANPISMSEYYKAGTYVASNQGTSATDGVAIPTSGAIRMGMFRGLTKAVAGTGGTYASTAVYAGRTSAGTATAGVVFNTDGTMTGTTAGQTSGNSVSGTSWYAPTTASIGSSYWVRATLNSAATTDSPSGLVTNIPSTTPTSGTMGSWLALSTAKSWSNSATGTLAAATGKYSQILFEISNSSSGSPVLYSGYIDILAVKDAG